MKYKKVSFFIFFSLVQSAEGDDQTPVQTAPKVSPSKAGEEYKFGFWSDF